MRVLIVEDDPGVQEYISHVLTDAGYTTLSANSIAAAAALLEGNVSDLIVLDLHLPNGLGRRLVEKLKEARNDVPIVILTGYPEDVPAEFPVSCVLSKPCANGELLRAVDKAQQTADAIKSIRNSTQRLRGISERSF